MTPAKPQNRPEVFRPSDQKWASRAAARGEIRRVSRGLYTDNLQEPLEQLVRRRWSEIATIYFPGATVVDRSAIVAGPVDGILFLEAGPRATPPRPVQLPGLVLRPRVGPGPVPGDMEFVGLHMSSPERMALDNLRPSRARSGIARTLGKAELEEWLDGMARLRGIEALNELRDRARQIKKELDAEGEFEVLDGLIGAMLGTGEAPLTARAAKARQTGLGYDTVRLGLFETLRSDLASQRFAERVEPPDPLQLAAFFEAYFSNWIEGTEFEIEEAERIVFDGIIPTGRPADAHDVKGTFEAVISAPFRSPDYVDADDFEDFLRRAHRKIMGMRPDKHPGVFKDRANRVGGTTFVHPEMVRGTLREGFKIGSTVPAGLGRAIFMMFLVSEVHPFVDRNGRVARLAMNGELSSLGLCRILIPMVFRDEYLDALRAMSNGSNSVPLSRTLDRAQRWTSLLSWTDRSRAMRDMIGSNALVIPAEAAESNIHLQDPKVTDSGAA